MRGRSGDDVGDTAADDLSGGDGHDDLDSPAALPGRPGAPALPAPPGSAAGPRRWPRRRAVGVAVAAAVVVLGAGAVARGAALRDAEDAGPPLDGSASASELFPVLAQEGSASAYPDTSLATALGVVPSSAHRLAVTPGVVFWVAQDAGGGVCLLARELAGGGSSDGACSTAAELAQRPLTLPTGSGGAALAPRGLDVSGLVAEGYASLGSGLWVDPTTADGIVEAAVDGTATRIVVVPSESHRGSASLPVVTADDLAPYAVVLACLQPTRVEVAVDGAEATPTDCAGGSIARHLTGAGRPVRVRVVAPAGLVWAASVVACTGPLADPVC